jgi:dephospho-CoA kinase
MSGTGKSTALAELARRGFRIVDTDEPGWKVGELWDETNVARLLADDGPTLFVSGTVENQGRFYDRFDAVVLLSAPADVIFERIATRTSNPWGKSQEQQDLIREHIRDVEPLLRATCTHEIDASLPLAEVVERLMEIAAS